MNICVFDTETTSLEKPFCYNIGYVIINTDKLPWTTLVKKDFVVEQVWHNTMLFSTAYYADKRNRYVKSMKGRNTIMDKFGYITQEMIRDFKSYGITDAYAYNSAFDEKVFDFNCDWFKCINPFDDVAVHDIRGYVCNDLIDVNYKIFCEKNEYFTDSGNYSTTAETVYRFIYNDTSFIEEHTALSDSIIESEILEECYTRGSDITKDYKCPRSIAREIEKIFTVKKNNEILLSVPCSSVTFRRTKNQVYLK